MADEKLFPGLASGAAESAPAAGNEENKASPAAPLDLFAQAPAGDTATAGSGMMDSVISSQSTDAILGPKPKTSVSLAASESHLGGWIIKFALVAGVLIYAFFFTQLSPKFNLLGQNPVQKLAAIEATMAEEQTTINLTNLLMAKFALDEFNMAADAYLLEWERSQSDYASSNAREASLTILATLREPLIASLTEAKQRLAQPLYPAFVAQGGASIIELEDRYGLLLKQYILSVKPEGSAGVLQLLNDKTFRKELKALNVETDLTPEKVDELYAASTQLSKNVFSAVLSIKNQRPDWLEVLNALKQTTRRVDPLYGSTIEGNLAYSNIVLNADNNTVSVRGQSRTDDSLNFSLLSNLIDAFEQSPMFSDVSNRTFSKSDTGSVEGVTSSFNLAFSLQTGEDDRDVVVPMVAVEAAPVADEATYGAAETPEAEVIPEAEAAEPTEPGEQGPSASAPGLAFAPLSVNLSQVLPSFESFKEAWTTVISTVQTELQAAVLKAKPKPTKTNPRVKRVPRK